MSAWGRYVLAFSSLGVGNKATQPQFQCFRICVVTSLCPFNEGYRFFYFLMSPWEGNMIQMTTGRESREQKMVKCCIAGISFGEGHMPFWNK